MLRFVVIMVMPVLVFIYTLSFARWLKSRKNTPSAPAYLIAVLSLGISGYVLWQMLL